MVSAPATERIAAPANLGPEAAPATSEWFKRDGYYAAQAVANAERAHWRSIERRLDKPSRRWTGREVVRSYRTNSDGDRRFRDEAEVFRPHGYRPWLATDSPGNRYGGWALVAVSGDALWNESDGGRRRNRQVSWVKDASLSEGAFQSAPPNRRGAEMDGR